MTCESMFSVAPAVMLPRNCVCRLIILSVPVQVDYIRRDLLSLKEVVNNILTMIIAGHKEIGTALT